MADRKYSTQVFSDEVRGKIGNVADKVFRGSSMGGRWGAGKGDHPVDLKDNTPRTTRDKGPVPSGRAGFDQSKLSTIPKAPPTTPAVSHERMNQGGGPGQESPGAGMIRDSFPGEHAHLFAKPGSGGPVGPRPGLRDGVYLPMGGFGTGGMVNTGDIASKQTGAVMDANFTGQPTMYPVQQSMGSDIFSDTQALIDRRAKLQAGMDAFFAKNPMGNDLMANFNNIASQAGTRQEIREIGERLKQRDLIMGNLQGIMMQGQNQMGVQGLQNQGNLQVAGAQGQNQMNTQLLQNRGGIDIAKVQGQNALDNTRLQMQGQLQNTALAGENQQRVAQIGEEGADRRAMLNSQTDLAKSAATGATEKDVMTAYTSLVQKLADPNIDPETRTKIQQDIDLLKKQISAFNIKGRQIAQ